MKFIGITGGVGAGKSTVLSLLKKHTKCIIVLADELAAELMEPGHDCYDQVVALDWDRNIIGDDGQILRPEMAAAMYADTDKRKQVNDIVHPAVQKEILNQVEKAKGDHNIEYFFFEAALLIECGYDKLCNELWYVHADSEIRRERLKKGRGYSDERVDAMMASQLSEDVFRSYCQEVIDNSGDEGSTERNIIDLLNRKK